MNMLPTRYKAETSNAFTLVSHLVCLVVRTFSSSKECDGETFVLITASRAALVTPFSAWPPPERLCCPPCSGVRGARSSATDTCSSLLTLALATFCCYAGAQQAPLTLNSSILSKHHLRYSPRCVIPPRDKDPYTKLRAMVSSGML